MRPLVYGSVCSGIEAASVAWAPLGWSPAWFAEIDPFCCSLLSQRYAEVKNLGDIRSVRTSFPVDVLVGGTPCQAFSVTGKQQGIDDPRGYLAVEFCRIIYQARPTWILWENVAGVLSSNRGRDFGRFLWTLAELGYWWSWRVLDARFFGVPQRRRRLFLVASRRNWRYPAAILFDQQTCGSDVGETEEAQLRRSRGRRKNLEANCFGWTGDATPKFAAEVVPTLRAEQGGEGVGILTDRNNFRRLIPSEWERFQGFPKDYTLVEHNGKPASDKSRTRALGNSFCVQVVRWIGQRIQALEEIHYAMGV